MTVYSFARKNGKWELKRTGYYETIKSGENREEVYSQTISYLRIHGGTLKIHGYDGTVKEELNFTKRNAPPKMM